MSIPKITLLSLALTLALHVNSQSGSVFINQIDARSVALGSTYIASANSNTAFTNLASSSVSTKSMELDLHYRPWISELSEESYLMGASAYFSTKYRSSFTLGFMHYTMPTIPLSDEDGNATGSFQPTELNIALGYGFKITDLTAVSLTLHYLDSKLGENNSASTVFADLGFKSRYNNLDYGFMIRNLGSSLSFNTQDVPLTLTFAAGAHYTQNLGEQHQLSAGSDLSYVQQKDASGSVLGVGAEYGFRNTLFARTGYNYVSEELGLSALSVGGGLQLKGVSIDFAYLLSNNLLNNNFNLSCAFRLNKTKPKLLVE